MQEPFLEIKYRKLFPIFFLTCSIIILYATLVVGFTPNSILGLIMLPLSILMLTRSIISITRHTIQMKNLLGMTVKEYPYTPDQISIRNGGIFVNEKKVFSAWWTNTNIRKISAFLQQNDAR